MSPIKRAVKYFGSQAALAKAIGVSQVFVCHMCAEKRKVPPRLCRLIEHLTGGDVCAEELRPDVFCPPEEQEAA